MVMEDLESSNFTIYLRDNGLTKEHFKVALRKSARMHAASQFFDPSLNNEVSLLFEIFYLYNLLYTLKKKFNLLI